MNLRKSLLLSLAVLLLFSLLLGACSAPVSEATTEPAGQAEAEEPAAASEEPDAEPTDAPTGAQTEEPTEAPAPDAVLDENVGAFLAGMEGFNATTPDVVHMQIEEGETPFLLDVRNPDELEANGYIEGTVNIPLADLAQNIDKLPAADTPIVAYCGVGARSAVAAMALGALGYTDVMVMQGGSFGGWVEAGYPVVEGLPEEAPALNAFEPDPAALAAVETMLQGFPQGWGQAPAEIIYGELDGGTELVFVDVRSPAEVEAHGEIEGSINIPLEQFVELKGDWPAPDANIVTYCGVGHRGTLAMTILRAYGYENVRNLNNGLGPWLDAGLPVVGGREAEENVDAPVAASEEDITAFAENVQAFLDGAENYNSITLDEVHGLIEAGTPPRIVDLRPQDDMEQSGHFITGAVNIPLKLLAYNLTWLPNKSETIVVYGETDTEAAIATLSLGALGYTDVRAMQGGGIDGWRDAGFPTQRISASGPG